MQLDSLEIVSRSTPLPFQLDEENVDDNVRMRYRWLDLRRPKLQRNIRLRGQMVGAIRRVMEAAGFVDIQTPILWKPTPEGARDFLVPSRLQPGRFYALPQSPQIAKQLLVISGFERYYQIAICFRDEDLRADRVQEITQLDVEMAFPDQEFLLGLMETMVSTVWRECIGVELETPFAAHDLRRGRPALRLGQARPALRPRDRGRHAITRGSEFGVFAGAEAVSFLRVPQHVLAQRARGARGVRQAVGRQGPRLPRVRRERRGSLADREVPLGRASSPLSAATPGQTLLFAADAWPMTSRVLGALRTELGARLGLIDEAQWAWLWITDFPMFEWDEEEQRWGAVHHPFTRPTADGKSGSTTTRRTPSPSPTT